jgi:hypothetical protein
MTTRKIKKIDAEIAETRAIAEEIYILSGYVHYEGSTVICAFLDKSDAEKFMKKCYAYDSKMPTINLDDSDELWEKYNIDSAKWSKKHPAKCTGLDGYSIDTILLK